MASLITSEKEISKIFKMLELLRSKGYNQKTIEAILDNIIPDNKQYMVTYQFGKDFYEPAFFLPDNHTINISLDDLKNFINKIMMPIKITDDESVDIVRKELFHRLVMFVLLHEVEHVKQYLIAEGFTECPYNLVGDIYKNLFTFKCDDEMDPELAKIKQFIFFNSKHRHSYKFVLERNANVRVYDMLSKVCDYEEEKYTFKAFFELQKVNEEANGYFGISNGAAENSYRKLLLGKLFDSFSKDEDICVEDRILYGLPLDLKTRIKVLTKKYHINKKHT